MAQALPQVEQHAQLPLHAGWAEPLTRRGASGEQPSRGPLCAACRQKEARYGFGDDEEPSVDRPRTLCFACFRIEIVRREAVRARLARGWNARQVALPLDETLQALSLRRRRAQIAARHALGL